MLQINGQEHHLAQANLKNLAMWKQPDSHPQQQTKMLTDHKQKQSGVYGDRKQGQQIILRVEDMQVPGLDE